ncbi:MAG: SLBB domain-containing protein [Desulfosarcinaceae bacterium]|nr:SLBB domain-containing protein [Desulfosarcinaceae bacterium]
MDKETLIRLVGDAGVVGEGGAGFPAHVKYDTQVDTVIANGCECEPLLYTDQHIMQRHTAEIVAAMQALVSITGARRGVIGIKRKYSAIADQFRQAMAGSGLELAELANFYPAGDEFILVREVTGRTIPPLGLPKAVDAVVANVGTLVNVQRALEGIPVTRKVVTVTGEVARPAIIEVPVGTRVLDCIANCGGARVSDPVVILGGPMMGRIVEDADRLAREVITKTNGGIIVLPRGHYLHTANTIPIETLQKQAAVCCIQCRYCTDLCPRYLLGHGFETHKVMRAFSAGIDAAQEAVQAYMCCECGVCELFACPMRISPRRINALLKQRFQEQKVGYEGPREVIPSQSSLREFRKVPLDRLAYKIGIDSYMGLHPQFMDTPVPSEVRLPLNQHIGAPADPQVQVGDRVAAGDRIAAIPEGALGANLHASIAGVVTAVDSAITIQGAD